MYRVKIGIEAAEQPQRRDCFRMAERRLPIRFRAVRIHFQKNWRYSKFHTNEARRSLKWSSRHTVRKKMVKKTFAGRKRLVNRKPMVSYRCVPAGPMLAYAQEYLKYPIRINDTHGGWCFDLTFCSLEDMMLFRIGFTP